MGLLTKVREVIAEFRGEFDGQLGEQFERIAARVEEPLRVAVAGRVKAGKSTLVNALLRQRVAPTDVSECTKVVTWFRHGQPQRVTLRLRDGGTMDLRLEDDGTLPRTLPVEPASVASLQVFLDNDALLRMTVIDTPGLGSLNEEISASSAELLAMERSSVTAAGAADAVAFVLNQAVKEDEIATLKDWSVAGAGGGGAPPTSAVNAIGVLTKADKVGRGLDPWPAAVELAARQAERIGSDVSTVVPVIGLLAETAKTASLTETDVGHLERIATKSPSERERMLWDGARFLSADVEAPIEARQRLLARLDLFGLRYLLTQIDNGARGAVGLTDKLAAASGIDELEHQLEDNFLDGRNELLRARSALEAMQRLSLQAPESANRRALSDLRKRYEQLLAEPELQDLAELDALHSVLVGDVELPAALRRDLERLTSSRDPALKLGLPQDADSSALRAAAAAGVARWKEFALTADPNQQRIARIVVRAYTRLFKAAGGQ